MMTTYSCSVTIGIPVYNAEMYIERCLKSVLEQTFQSIEILLVDDCGNDQSIERAERMINEHPRGGCVRVVRHERNMGVAHARNTIVREACGKYLLFVDSDDQLSENAVSLLYDKAEQYNADTVWGSYQCVADNPQHEYIKQYPDIQLLGEDKLVEYDCQNVGESLQAAIWNILYRLDFLRVSGIMFEQHGSLDDLIFQYRIQPKVMRAVLMSDVTYYYYVRNNSISNFQSRVSFKRAEAVNAMEAAKCLKDSCTSIMEKSYFDRRCTKAMQQCLYFCYGILRHRKMMDQPVSDKEIRDMMKHPSSIWRIIRFKHCIAKNLFFYILGVMPPFIMVSVVKLIAQKNNS